jgi:hypothetical protein
MSSRAIRLSGENVVVGVVYRIEMVWRLFSRYVHRCNSVMVVVDKIDVLARLVRRVGAWLLDGRPE